TLFTILPPIIAGLSIVQIYHEDLKGSFIAVEGIVLIAGILFSFFIARKLILLVEQLSEKMREAAKMNAYNSIEPTTQDGVGGLTEPFNHMIRVSAQSKGASKEGKERY